MDLLGIWQVYFGKIPSPLRHCTEETGGGQMMFPAVLVKPGISQNLSFLLQQMTSLCNWCLQSGWIFFICSVFFFFNYILDGIF